MTRRGEWLFWLLAVPVAGALVGLALDGVLRLAGVTCGC